jgi:hypothetical protein
MSKIDWLNDYKRATGCTLGDARRAWEQMYAKMAENTELRDRAALAALQGILSNPEPLYIMQRLIGDTTSVSKAAWVVADAFIAARETKEGKE